MKTTARQALRFAACARAPMRQARCAGTALMTMVPLRARVTARRPGDLAAPGGGGRRSPLHQVTAALCRVQATHVGGHVSRPGRPVTFSPPTYVIRHVRGERAPGPARACAPGTTRGPCPGGPGGDGQPIGVTVRASVHHRTTPREGAVPCRRTPDG